MSLSKKGRANFPLQFKTLCFFPIIFLRYNILIQCLSCSWFSFQIAFWNQISCKAVNCSVHSYQITFELEVTPSHTRKKPHLCLGISNKKTTTLTSNWLCNYSSTHSPDLIGWATQKGRSEWLGHSREPFSNWLGHSRGPVLHESNTDRSRGQAEDFLR